MLYGPTYFPAEVLEEETWPLKTGVATYHRERRLISLNLGLASAYRRTDRRGGRHLWKRNDMPWMIVIMLHVCLNC